VGCFVIVFAVDRVHIFPFVAGRKRHENNRRGRTTKSVPDLRGGRGSFCCWTRELRAVLNLFGLFFRNSVIEIALLIFFVNLN